MESLSSLDDIPKLQSWVEGQILAIYNGPRETPLEQLNCIFGQIKIFKTANDCVASMIGDPLKAEFIRQIWNSNTELFMKLFDELSATVNDLKSQLKEKSIVVEERPVIVEQPINPKSSTYESVEGGVDDHPKKYDTNHVAAPILQFPVGEHPLEGVYDCDRFEIPNEFTARNREIAEEKGLINLIGDYRSRCLWSKNWAVREAVFQKILLMLRQEFILNPGIAKCVEALCAMINIGLNDKILQVHAASVDLMEEVLKAARSSMPRSLMIPACEPILIQLVDKIGDTNGRIRDTAKRGLLALAESTMIGPTTVAEALYKPLPAGVKNWRPLEARIALLSQFIVMFGLSDSGLTHDPMLNFLKTNGAYSHSNGEVRDAAKTLVVNIHKVLGPSAVECVLSELRGRQKSLYLASFGETYGEYPGKEATPKIEADVPLAPTKANIKSESKASTSSPEDKKATEVVGSDGQYTCCMFCLKVDPTWKEDDLDLHYWKECPLLISCPSCAQIVEIAALPEHQLNECDDKGLFVSCEVTGLAVRATEFEAWKSGPNYKAPPSNYMYCPLCISTVADSDDAWKTHLTSECKKNARVK